MNKQLLQSFANNGTHPDRSVALELAACNRKYPWFAAGHLMEALISQQLQLEGADQQVQKALLYSSDPVWLDWQYRQHLGSNPAAMQESTATELKQQQEADAVINAGTLIETEDVLEAVVENAATTAELLVEAAAAVEVTEPVAGESINGQESLTTSEEKDASIPVKVPETGAVTTEAATEEPLLFEPYHTVDYFASQGIRLQEEKLGNDDLSKQVKTFTQWLRSMKKIYAEDHHPLEQQEEAEVLHIAQHSNQQEEIVTETMARVLQQQGKKTKAIEIYHKLSLLHPEKSAYFATLIHDLNKEK